MKIREYDSFSTNIKNLPEGEYMTETGYSQTYAFKVIKRTATTATLQPVKVEKDPEWKPEFVSGGFAGHCTNQHKQTWLYSGLGDDTITVRLIKSRYCESDKLWGSKGREFIANGAEHHYDYNF